MLLRYRSLKAKELPPERRWDVHRALSLNHMVLIQLQGAAFEGKREVNKEELQKQVGRPKRSQKYAKPDPWDKQESLEPEAKARYFPGLGKQNLYSRIHTQLYTREIPDFSSSLSSDTRKPEATPIQSIRHSSGEIAELRASQGYGWRPQLRLVRAIKAYWCLQGPAIQTQRPPETLVLVIWAAQWKR